MTASEKVTSCTGSDTGSDRAWLLEGEIGHHVTLHQPDQPVRTVERPVTVNGTRDDWNFLGICRG